MKVMPKVEIISSEKCLLNTQEALGLLQSITQTKCGT